MTETLKFLQNELTLEQFLSEQDQESIHGTCHNACVWLISKCHKHGLLPYDTSWVIGQFHGKDHSWLEIEDVDHNSTIVFDLTVGQFSATNDPYIGPRTKAYEPFQAVNAAFVEDVISLSERVGR